MTNREPVDPSVVRDLGLAAADNALELVDEATSSMVTITALERSR